MVAAISIGGANGRDGDGQVVAVDEGDVVKVAATATPKGEFGQRCWVSGTLSRAVRGVADVGIAPPKAALPVAGERIRFRGALSDKVVLDVVVPVRELADYDVIAALVLDDDLDIGLG